MSSAVSSSSSDTRASGVPSSAIACQTSIDTLTAHLLYGTRSSAVLIRSRAVSASLSFWASACPPPRSVLLLRLAAKGTDNGLGVCREKKNDVDAPVSRVVFRDDHHVVGEPVWVLIFLNSTSSGLVAGRRPRVWTGFGPFEKPSAPAFSVHAEIRALS